MSAAASIWGAVLTIVFVYGLPKIAEFELLRHMVSPTIFVLTGDLLGSALIFMLGFRKTAVAVYISATAVEAALLFFHVLEPKWVMLAEDAAPTLTLLLIMLYMLSYDRLPVE
jgi:hypothetical protein